jgi:hypothetical protein
MKLQAILSTLVILPIATAFAADGAKPKRDPAQIFRGLDANADGALTFEEWKAGMVGHVDPARMPVLFKQKDADADGKLALAEFIYVPPQPVAAAPAEKPKAEKPKKEKKASPAAKPAATEEKK